MNSQITRALLFSFILLELLVLGISCVSSRKIVYFNDVKDTTFYQEGEDADATIQKNDILSISISSLNPQASEIFNTPNNFVINSTTSAGSTTQSSGYLVNNDGNIQLPILGNIQAAGITKKQLKDTYNSNDS